MIQKVRGKFEISNLYEIICNTEIGMPKYKIRFRIFDLEGLTEYSPRWIWSWKVYRADFEVHE